MAIQESFPKATHKNLQDIVFSKRITINRFAYAFNLLHFASIT